MKKEFELDVTWLPFEIHPETPPEGVLLSEKFQHMDRDAMIRDLNRGGDPYGIRFGEMKSLYNSRAALEASELARDRGVYEEMHNRLFYAYFVEVKNIGDPEVLYGIAEDAGLKREELAEALEEGTYRERLKSSLADGQKSGVTAVPTFVLNSNQIITGAQPLERFRSLLAGGTGITPLQPL